MEEYTLVGKIVEINYNKTRIIIDIKGERYLIYYTQYSMNKYGYIPKLNHWIEVTGMVLKSDDVRYVGQIKKIKNFNHLF